jgi:hypothetical protein
MLVTVAVLILSAIFGLIMVGLSIWANARFRQEPRLPMQWMISKSQPLSQTVIRSAPRVFVLSFTPFLAICVLSLVAVGAMTLTPRPGEEGMLLPSVLLIGSVFVAAHVFHLWLIERTLNRNGG